MSHGFTLIKSNEFSQATDVARISAARQDVTSTLVLLRLRVYDDCSADTAGRAANTINTNKRYKDVQDPSADRCGRSQQHIS